MDVTSGLLDEVRAEGAVFCRNLLVPPWSLGFEDSAAMTVVVMLRGAGVVVMGGAPGRRAGAATHHLRAGDIAVLTGARSFRLTDGSPRPGPARYVVREGGACTTEQGHPLQEPSSLGGRTCGDGDDAPTAVLTGSYRVGSRVARRVLEALPPVIVVPDERTLRPLMDLTVTEVERELPGQQAVLDRVLDLLLLSTLRTWFARQEVEALGWFAALSDPVLGAALRSIHDGPGEPWSVSTLAHRAGVSRATFARRFTATVGETPMAYVTRHRLAVASDLLGSSHLTVDAVARRVGYQSGFALSAAFKRVFGQRPSDARAAA